VIESLRLQRLAGPGRLGAAASPACGHSHCSRVDLTSLLFGWHRLRLASEHAVVSDGGERPIRRIVEVAGEDGARCTVA
jgi:hypothetical protein